MLSSKNMGFVVKGTNKKDPYTMPWISAYPIFGSYRVTNIEELKDIGLSFQLEPKTGKATLLQQIRGQGGLLILGGDGYSGLWRSTNQNPKNSFGLLRTTNEVLVALKSTLKIDSIVLIDNISQMKDSKQESPMADNIKRNIAISDCGIPTQERIQIKDNQDIQLLVSENSQIITTKIYHSSSEETISSTKQSQSTPIIKSVIIKAWHLPKDAEPRLIDEMNTNTNVPYIFQKCLSKDYIKLGDTIVFIVRELYECKFNLAHSESMINSLVDKLKECKTVDLGYLSTRLESLPNINQFEVQLWTDWMLNKYLVPVIIDDEVKWSWSKSPTNTNISANAYPVIHVYYASVRKIN